jgi:hypothetical protein
MSATHEYTWSGELHTTDQHSSSDCFMLSSEFIKTLRFYASDDMSNTMAFLSSHSLMESLFFSTTQLFEQTSNLAHTHDVGITDPLPNSMIQPISFFVTGSTFGHHDETAPLSMTEQFDLTKLSVESRGLGLSEEERTEEMSQTETFSRDSMFTGASNSTCQEKQTQCYNTENCTASVWVSLSQEQSERDTEARKVVIREKGSLLGYMVAICLSAVVLLIGYARLMYVETVVLESHLS